MLASALVCAVWVAVVIGRWWSISPGDDMACHYLAARLLNEGDTRDLYAYNPHWFNRVSNAAWVNAARESGVLRHFQDVDGPPKVNYKPVTEEQKQKQIDDALHPYVQVPLLPFVLRPLAGAMPFGPFNRLTMVLMVLATLGFVITCALIWNRRLLAPLPLALVLLAVLLSQPFRFSMHLNQSHPVLLLLITGSILASEKRRPGLAGVLLAVAAVIKITPAIVAVYWLFTGRRREAAWFAASAVGLMVLSVAATGVSTNVAYFHTLSRVSHVLLPSFCNQTVMGYLARRALPPSAALEMEMFPVPLSFKLMNAAAGALAAGVLAARVIATRRAGWEPDRVAVPALLLMTLLFAPIAWTHYYLLLLPSAAVLAGEAARQARQSRRQERLARQGGTGTDRPAWKAGWLVVAVIVALNLPPLAPVYRKVNHGGDQFFSSFFFAGLIGLVALMSLPLNAAPAAVGALRAGRRKVGAQGQRTASDGYHDVPDRMDEMELAPG